MCNHDCFNCQYADCIVEIDTAESDEIESIPFIVGFPEREIVYGTSYTEAQRRYNHSAEGRERYKRYEMTGKAKERRRRYCMTEKNKERLKRYEMTDKAKERRERYRNSEKGKAMLKRQQEKRIASGKNAEACRRYREKKKLEKMNGFV